VQSIPAANNLNIEADEFTWRLTNNDATPLVEANGDGIFYPTAFARARKLPEAGLRLADIEMIIVGWEEKVWQLGLLLTVEAAQGRGGRWCGIVRWQDETASREAYSARTAGQLLAGVTGKPYQFVQPPVFEAEETMPVLVVQRRPLDTSPTDATLTIPALPQAPLLRLPDVAPLTLPLTVGDWSLREMKTGLSWTRSQRWRRETLLRGLFFVVLTAAFAYLTIGGLTTNFASVQPEWLPYVGLVVMILMALNALYRFGTLFAAGRVEFDRRNRMVRVFRRASGVVKQFPFEKIEYLLVSTMLMRHRKVATLGTGYVEQIALEGWLHLMRQKGDFMQVAHVTQAEGRAIRVPEIEPTNSRVPLDTSQFDTPLHQAARAIADLIEVPAYVEERG